MLLPRNCLLAAVVFAVAGGNVAARPPRGKTPRSLSRSLRGSGFSLIQRWAGKNQHGLQLAEGDFASYIATGSLPAEKATEERNSTKQFEKILGNMKEYEKKLDGVRLQAESATKAVTDQEKRLTGKFIPIKRLLEGLIATSASVAAKAEVQTTLERLEQKRYQTIGYLDRSATHWLEIIAKEKEARRVAEGKKRLEMAVLNATSKETQRQIKSLKKAAETDRASYEKWREDYWARLEAALKTGSNVFEVPIIVKEQPRESEKAEQEQVLVPAVPGQYIVGPRA